MDVYIDAYIADVRGMSSAVFAGVWECFQQHLLVCGDCLLAQPLVQSIRIASRTVTTCSSQTGCEDVIDFENQFQKVEDQRFVDQISDRSGIGGGGGGVALLFSVGRAC